MVPHIVTLDGSPVNLEEDSFISDDVVDPESDAAQCHQHMSGGTSIRSHGDTTLAPSGRDVVAGGVLDDETERVQEELDCGAIMIPSVESSSLSSITSAVSMLPNFGLLYQSNNREEEVKKSNKRSHRRGPARPVKARLGPVSQVVPVELFYPNGLKCVEIREDCTTKCYYTNRSLALALDRDDSSYRMFGKHVTGDICIIFDGRGVGSASYLCGKQAFIKSDDGSCIYLNSEGKTVKKWNCFKKSPGTGIDSLLSIREGRLVVIYRYIHGTSL